MSTPSIVDMQHAANAGILRFLAAKGGRPLNGPPDSVPSPYLSLGTHPDAVEWLWKTLNARLPADCRWIVLGTVVLVHPTTGILFACGGGTDYLLRLPPPLVPEALQQGATQVKTYGVRGRVLDLRDYDPSWVFGRWKRDEEGWCSAAYQAVSTMQGGGGEAG